MTTYAIGDLQGCHTQLIALLEKIDAITPNAQLVFVGDIVNRGPKSLATLRQIYALRKRARIVLGNHDLNLLAVACGLRKPHNSDTLDDVLAADDREELLTWLRHQPLAIEDNGYLYVHAGVLPQWSAQQTLALSREVEAVLQGDDWPEFLKKMYGNEPALWDDKLQGADRLRCIVNALTRIRFCTPDGSMNLKAIEGADHAPEGLLPWFDLPNRKTEDCTVVFGHWSTLGLLVRLNVLGLDTGCVWGGKLTAINLQDRSTIQVDCPQHQKPGKKN
ncbi:symmetrical bis(5'-nucleosyl)-tetraphosphatase [Herminiimonas fonticola]|uniref:Bis(5'-nucleosyl)-tetraphosphatase, symmetrical n=1 Tax=Herminiimonas fonticola TaxID=303380 RepID=A0A4R6GH67_9BURK|nr:symmetrical bis(5'-nucleosyl)-tetraphosphatase [Herminiimonas fonticola]RBA25194.1 apaH: bis(5'-nucleosyl)-tetraphosphatase (symmetrical) [Herminiimonas fonticola]TDN94309.1 bis(5'nucleosyl)-tetraphosphatase ApaH [Herminiimonas fonticola]